MIDPSYLEFLRAVISPFTEEFDELWRALRILCFGLLFSGMVLLGMAYLVLGGESLAEATATVSTIGWLAFCSGILLYFLCAWHAWSLHRGRSSDRETRYRSYDD